MNPYDLSTRELLDKFMNACASAGVSNSGLAISFSAGSDLVYAHYLRGAVEARIDRANPPFKLGQNVRPNKKEIQPARNNDRRYDFHPRPRKLPKLLTVKTVYYRGDNKWECKFAEQINDATAYYELMDDGDKTWKELRPLRFNAEDFDLIEEQVPAQTR